jgi:hypothetical protein
VTVKSNEIDLELLSWIELSDSSLCGDLRNAVELHNISRLLMLRGEHCFHWHTFGKSNASKVTLPGHLEPKSILSLTWLFNNLS